MKKTVSIMLIFAILFSTLTVYADDSANISDVVNQEDYSEELIGINDSLNNEAKLLLEEQLRKDPELLEYHIKYVDPDFKFTNSLVDTLNNEVNFFSARSMSISSDALDVLNNELLLLQLSASVRHALNTLAASAISTGIDGPSLIVDVVAGFAAAGGIIVLAANWNELEENWPGIKAAFRKAFGVYANQVSSLLDTMYDMVESFYSVPSVEGQNIYVKGRKYRCNEVAEEMAYELQGGSDIYFPAVVYWDSVYMCPVGVPKEIAVAIMKINDKKSGIMCLTRNRARGLCYALGGIRHDHGPHGGSGYWPHYHANQSSNSHAWYFGF